MTKILKKVQLSTEQSARKSANTSKGTVTNPFTKQEYRAMVQEQNWVGGYVEGEGYITSSPETVVYYPFYMWPSMPIVFFIEMCKLFLNKNAVYNDICYVFGLSQIEKDYFHRYWYAEGDKTLTKNEFDAIISAIGNALPTSTINVTIDEKVYVRKQYNLSGNSTYKYVFGSTCYVFYSNNESVGFRDDYDFNPLDNWEARGTKGELYTRAMHILGPFYGAKDYSIYYGIHE